MEGKKISFFKRVKMAITDFDSYGDMALEKLSIAIKYYAKVMLIFSAIIAISFTYKFSTIINNDEELQVLYSQVKTEYNVDDNAIQDAVNTLKSNNNNANFYVMLGASIWIYLFSIYFIMGFLDVFLLSILGFIVSRFTRMKLRYKPAFIMAIYALTLPIFLNAIYIVANTLTGFTIEYFPIVYNVIAYIYIITAILMIKADFITRQQELIKIIEEEQRVKREAEQEEQDKKEEKEEDNTKEDNDKNKDEKEDNQKQEPEGNEA